MHRPRRTRVPDRRQRPPTTTAGKLARLDRVVLLIMFALGVTIGCGDQSPPLTRTIDFIGEKRFESQTEDLTPALCTCVDESYWALTLQPGESITVAIECSAPSQLQVGACSEPIRDEHQPRSSALRIDIVPLTGETSASIHREMTWDGGWHGSLLDLSKLGSRPAEATIVNQSPISHPIVLRDLVLSCREEPDASARDDLPTQVLLISIDTLREDALSLFGGSAHTPTLDWLASQSELFSPHYAAAGWTKPSHATMLTGYYPWLTGASPIDGAIHREISTLAERIRTTGIRTAALVHDCTWLNRRFGFNRGFQEYRVVPWRINRQITATSNWLTDHRDESFFYFLHSFEPHSDQVRLPYEARGLTRETILQRFGVPEYGRRGGFSASRMLKAIDRGKLEPLENEADILRFSYDRGVEHMDAAVGALLSHLQEIGIFDNMTIILTSDHGEAFLEHGQLLHGSFWDEVLRVPLIIKWTEGRRAAQRFSVPTSGIDLAPTILDIFGLNSDKLPGLPLNHRKQATTIFAEAGSYVVIDDQLKAVVNPFSDHANRLFDLSSDPEENDNLIDQRPTDFDRLHTFLDRRRAQDQHELEAIKGAHHQGDAILLWPEERERLKSLGYLDDEHDARGRSHGKDINTPPGR